MKPFHLLLALMAIAPTFANAKAITGAEMIPFCQAELTYNSDKDQCAQLVINKRFDENTVGLCASLTYASDKLQCLRIIADKQLEPTFRQFCSAKTYASEKISCANTYVKALASSPAPDTCALYEQRTVSRAQVALEDLERGDVEHAKEMLRRILAQ